MRRNIWVLLGVAGLLSFGCSKQGSTDKPAGTSSSSSSSGNPVTAPVDYLGAAARAQQNAAKTVAGVGLDQAIKMFYAQEGRFPKDLKELVPGQIPNIPAPPRGMKYQYNAQSGEVKIVPE
jgi:hypothetical protein